MDPDRSAWDSKVRLRRQRWSVNGDAANPGTREPVGRAELEVVSMPGRRPQVVRMKS
jgi:hypothetical protein